MRSVSVIIPTYNYGRFIGLAIDSVVAQSHPIREIIVIDDGSTDETEIIVKGYGNKVTYKRQQNQGVSTARNLGVSFSSGDLVAFLDADDTWHPDKIEKQVAKFDENPSLGLVHCGMREFDSETGKTLNLWIEGTEGWVANDLILFQTPNINVSGSVLMTTRNVFDEIGGFDPKLKNGEDWEFCLRVAKKYAVGFVAEPLVNYRNHGANATKNVAEMERSTLIAWSKAFDTDDQSLLKLRRRSYGNLHKVLAGSYLHYGQYSGFTRNVIKSLWFRPSFIGYYLRLLAGRRRDQ